MKLIKRIISRGMRFKLFLTMILLWSAVEINAMSYPMTTYTKAVFAKIVNEYDWGAIREAVGDDIESFAASMNKAQAQSDSLCFGDSLQNINDKLYLKALRTTDFNVIDYDKYWKREKVLIGERYKYVLSKMNFIQKKFLFANLKKFWKKEFVRYRYNYALLEYCHLDADYKSKLDQRKKFNSEFVDNINKLKTQELLYVDKNKQLEKEIDDTKKSMKSISDEIQNLLDRQQQIINTTKSIIR